MDSCSVNLVAKEGLGLQGQGEKLANQMKD
jgi:hypothetical protein